MPWAVFVQECPCYYLGGCGVSRGAAVYNYLANPQKALKMYPWMSGESDSLHIINLSVWLAWNSLTILSWFLLLLQRGYPNQYLLWLVHNPDLRV